MTYVLIWSYAHVLSRPCAKTRHARVCARIFTKLFVKVLYYLMSLSFKFREDPSFGCEDICKTIMTFCLILNFLYILHIFLI